MTKIYTVIATAALQIVLMKGVMIVSARADSVSKGESVYAAGKAKYCKESPVSGYLDCFYASMDSCERHNKSTTLLCVANPNSGM